MGSFEVVEHKNDPATVTLNADEATLSIGAQGIGGGNISLLNWEGKQFLFVDGSDSSLQIGTTGRGGNIRLIDYEDRRTFWFDGSNANMHIGSLGNAGNIYLKDELGRSVFHLDGPGAALNVGLSDNAGNINVFGANNNKIFEANGKNSRIYVRTNAIQLDGYRGDIILKDQEDVHAFGIHTRTSFDNPSAGLWIGSSQKIDGVANKAGNITLRDNKGNNSVRLRGGSENRGGSISLCDELGKDTIAMVAHRGGDNTATIRIGGRERNGQIIMRDDRNRNTLLLDGRNGDIMLQNSDCAEEFDISETEITDKIESGTVMVLDNNGKLKVSQRPYDTLVAGVVSGAGDYKPGIILGKKMSKSLRAPIAVVGKVFCKVEANDSPIRVGDLLTTSNIPGHAMKATHISKAFGAVIGKALSPLKSGRGLIPILVSLQ
jgi:hypothetical protein